MAGGSAPTPTPIGGTYAAITAPPAVDATGGVVLIARLAGAPASDALLYRPDGAEFQAIVVGEPSPLPLRVRTFVSHCLRKPYGSNARAVVWHCEEEKKVYYVECIVDDSRLDLLDEVCERIPCHE